MEFDAWVCSDPHLESIIGSESYFELINVDYSDKNASSSIMGLVQNLYVVTLQGDLERDYVLDTLKSLLDGSLPLFDGCAILGKLRLDGTDFIPAVFEGYWSELEDSNNESFYRDRIVKDATMLLQELMQHGDV